MKNNNKGFTLIELMIATVILGVIILIASAAIVGLVRQFYKGINQARVQEVSRAVSDELAAGIQFSEDVPVMLGGSASNGAWCIGDQRYYYVIGKKLGGTTSNESPQVLVRDEDCAGGVTAPTGGVELMGENMRLIAFTVDGAASSQVFTVNLTVGIGEDDLYCSEAQLPGSCSNYTLLTPAQISAASDLQCRGGPGSQFCAVSRSSITVVKRL